MTRSTAERARRAAGWSGLLATAIAALGLAGYLFDLPVLTGLHVGFARMSPLTALALGLAGVGVACAAGARWAASRFCAVASGALAVIVLVDIAIAGSDRLSALLSHALFPSLGAPTGRVSPATALSLLLCSIGLCAARRPAWRDTAAGLAGLIAATALLGYAYGVASLYALPMFDAIALHTAFALLAVALGLLFVDPSTGAAAVVLSAGEGGGATRRQLSLLVVPIVAGALLDHATGRHWIGAGAALAMLVVLTIAPLALLIVRDGRIQRQLEHERARVASVQASAARDLEARLAAQSRQLADESAERMKAEASAHHAQRVEAIGQLTGGIAHDFNNLLAAIGGNLELTARRLPGDHAARRNVDSAMAAVRKGAKLAGQLLAFSRTQRLDIRPVRIDDVIDNAARLIASALGPDIESRFVHSTDDAWALTDADQLELAILNLSVNARDAMPDGGMLQVDVVPDPRATGTDAGPRVVVRVTDTGVGMSADVAARAVEPFFTTRERGKGPGLGLAQVHGFVKQCGGELEITSAPGHGTTIELMLPRVEAPATSAGRELLAAAAFLPSRRDWRVLVIDDDASVRRVIVDALTDAGYAVREADSGAHGLEALDAFAPDAAVIDFLMPGMNGAEVARVAQRRRPGLPVVFVSGYSDTLALDGIADAIVLRKPFELRSLSDAVEGALHTRRDAAGARGPTLQ